MNVMHLLIFITIVNFIFIIILTNGIFLKKRIKLKSVIDSIEFFDKLVLQY